MTTEPIKNNSELQVPNSKQPFTFCSYNVDMAVREEKYDETKWSLRKHKIEEFINTSGYDVICLQEMRQLDGNEDPVEWLAQFKDYNHVCMRRNPGKLAFGLAVLFKKDKFYLLESLQRWYSSTPEIPSDDWTYETEGKNGFGSSFIGVKLCAITGSKIELGSEFWVFNTHLTPFNEEVKTRSVNLLKVMVPTISSGRPFILSGDFNFFPDKKGPEQLALLSTIGERVTGYKTESGRVLNGTFIGYEHDEFKTPDSKNPTSILDHIVLSGFGYEQPRTSTKTYELVEPEELTNRNASPSDHLPLIVTLHSN